jgi:hypothetical protein
MEESNTTSRAPSPPPPPRRRSRPVLQPATPEQFNFRFIAGREFKEKLERLAEVLGVENRAAHMADFLEKAMDIALDKKDPKRRLERRRERQAKRAVEKGAGAVALCFARGTRARPGTRRLPV